MHGMFTISPYSADNPFTCSNESCYTATKKSNPFIKKRDALLEVVQKMGVNQQKSIISYGCVAHQIWRWDQQPLRILRFRWTWHWPHQRSWYLRQFALSWAPSGARKNDRMGWIMLDVFQPKKMVLSVVHCVLLELENDRKVTRLSIAG